MNETDMKASQEEVEGQITSQMDRLENALGKLDGISGSLRAQLKPILRESSVEEAEVGKEPQQLVPLATQLRKRRKEVSSVISQIEDMLSRIEL